ncbi:MAG: hypothetical protein R3C51_11250 [Parvularculaceae bacterium]
MIALAKPDPIKFHILSGPARSWQYQAQPGDRIIRAAGFPTLPSGLNVEFAEFSMSQNIQISSITSVIDI